MTSLGRVIDHDMASLLHKSVLPLFTCSKPVIRRKACALAFKLVIMSSDDDAVEELVRFTADRLNDSEKSVQLAAVGAIAEISRVNPKLFLVALPRLFKMVDEARDNWTLLKLVDILTLFAQVEQRLLPKLEPKFKQLLTNQQSKSLLLAVVKSTLELFSADSPIHT